jgi:YHS domain-containing protein
MFLSTTIATFALALTGAQAKNITCPIMGGPVTKDSITTEYNGARFGYCCPGCKDGFEKNPKQALSAAAKNGSAVGVFLFDPVSHKRLDAAKAKGGFSDFQGIRYYFESKENKKAFDKSAKEAAATPAKEALFCPVSKETIESYAKASGYADYEGVRYYFCCAGCDAPFLKDPAKLAPNAADKVHVPAAISAKASGSAGGHAEHAFACKHCGKTIKAAGEADMAKTCDVCACKKSNQACHPGK